VDVSSWLRPSCWPADPAARTDHPYGADNPTWGYTRIQGALFSASARSSGSVTSNRKNSSPTHPPRSPTRDTPPARFRLGGGRECGGSDLCGALQQPEDAKAGAGRTKGRASAVGNPDGHSTIATSGAVVGYNPYTSTDPKIAPLLGCGAAVRRSDSLARLLQPAPCSEPHPNAHSDLISPVRMNAGMG
jgi:hypothetical protein